MTNPLLQKARANRIAALESLGRHTGTNIYSLRDARQQRLLAAAPVAVMFTTRRAA